MPGTKHLDRDTRLRIRTLYYDAGLPQSEICRLTGATAHQVRYAIRATSADIAPRSGRPPKMSEAHVQQLIEYITSSEEGRRATFEQLSNTLFNGQYGAYTIRSTLRRQGFYRDRDSARRKPPISEQNR